MVASKGHTSHALLTERAVQPRERWLYHLKTSRLALRFLDHEEEGVVLRK